MITSLLSSSRCSLTQIDLLLLHNDDLWALWDDYRACTGISLDTSTT
jgi:hypothetical protein